MLIRKQVFALSVRSKVGWITLWKLWVWIRNMKNNTTQPYLLCIICYEKIQNDQQLDKRVHNKLSDLHKLLNRYVNNIGNLLKLFIFIELHYHKAWNKFNDSKIMSRIFNLYYKASEDMFKTDETCTNMSVSWSRFT